MPLSADEPTCVWTCGHRKLTTWVSVAVYPELRPSNCLFPAFPHLPGDTGQHLSCVLWEAAGPVQKWGVPARGPEDSIGASACAYRLTQRCPGPSQSQTNPGGGQREWV